MLSISIKWTANTTAQSNANKSPASILEKPSKELNKYKPKTVITAAINAEILGLFLYTIQEKNGINFKAFLFVKEKNKKK